MWFVLMIRRPPRSTLTDTLVPYTTRFRSSPRLCALHGGAYSSAYFAMRSFSLLERAAALGILTIALARPGYGDSEYRDQADLCHRAHAAILDAAIGPTFEKFGPKSRSDRRRVGKESVRPGRSRGSAEH